MLNEQIREWNKKERGMQIDSSSSESIGRV